MFLTSAGLLLESASAWNDEGNRHESLLDLSALFRMYASCSVEETEEGFQKWCELQTESYRLFEEVSGELALGQSHRSWFHGKVDKEMPISNHGLVALALNAEGVEKLQDFHDGLDKWEEEEIGADVDTLEIVPMFYQKIREVVEAHEGGSVLEPADQYAAEEDFERLQALAQNNWPAVDRENFESEHLHELVQSLVKMREARERLAVGLKSSLQEPGKVVVRYESESSPLAVNAQDEEA